MTETSDYRLMTVESVPGEAYISTNGHYVCGADSARLSSDGTRALNGSWTRWTCTKCGRVYWLGKQSSDLGGNLEDAARMFSGAVSDISETYSGAVSEMTRPLSSTMHDVTVSMSELADAMDIPVGMLKSVDIEHDSGDDDT